MGLFTIWIMTCAVAKNIQTLLIARLLCGLTGSAFLTVAGGTVSDLFAPAHIQHPMMLFTIAPMIGPALGPAVAGFINQFADWRWTFYVMLIWVSIFSGILFPLLLSLLHFNSSFIILKLPQIILRHHESGKLTLWFYV
jgi:MFS family permease